MKKPNFLAPINTDSTRVLDFTDQNETNRAVFYRTIDGDLVDTTEEAKMLGCDDTKVIVSGFFVGSLDEMRIAAQMKCDEFLRFCE